VGEILLSRLDLPGLFDFFLAGRNLVEYLLLIISRRISIKRSDYLQLKQNVKGEWVRWFAATLAGLVQWLRVGAGWVYGDYCCLLKGYLLNEQVEWSLRNERSEIK